MLVREFIRRALYAPAKGYFERTDAIVSDAGIAFKRLLGEWHYRRQLHRLFSAKNEAWLTPVEIFAPHYSQALARHILARRDPAHPLRVFEVGGGNGTNAHCILDFLRRQAPEVYAQCSYTLVDTSGPMHERQRRAVAGHGPRARCVHADFRAWDGDCDQPCFVLALEVLDNLPHDKVRLTAAPTAPAGGSPGAEAALWEEATVDTVGPGGALREVYRPASDPIVVEALALWGQGLRDALAAARGGSRAHRRRRRGAAAAAQSVMSPLDVDTVTGLAVPAARTNATFIPTGSLQLLHRLREGFPRHALLTADFTDLPPPQLGAQSRPRDGTLDALRAPLVAARDPATGACFDHGTYLVDDGSADVFFPVDFAALARAYHAVTGRRADCSSSTAFLERWADTAQTRTLTGYNPLLEDFANTAFLETAASERGRREAVSEDPS